LSATVSGSTFGDMTKKREIPIQPAGSASVVEDVDVKVFRDAMGAHAYVLPRSLRNLTPEQERMAAGVQLVGRQRLEADEQLEHLVASGRAAGLSWSALGWCLGVTGEAVRKAYGQ